MKAYQITHSIVDIAMIGSLFFENKIADEKTIKSRKTAHKMTITLKTYLSAIQKSGIVINPPSFTMVLKCPNFIMDFFFMIWLRTNMVKDMLLPDFANNANKEVVQLHNDLLKFLFEWNRTIQL